MKGSTTAIKISVLGCVVNGPGEAREADIGIAAGGGKGMIFKRGEKLYTVPESEMVDVLMKEIDIWEEEERAAGRLKSGAPSLKVDSREDDHDDCQEDENGRVGLPLLK